MVDATKYHTMPNPHRGRSESSGGHLSAALGNTDRVCDRCGFEGAIMAGGWSVRTGTDAHTGHVIYHLECPDCGTVLEVEMNIP